MRIFGKRKENNFYSALNCDGRGKNREMFFLVTHSKMLQLGLFGEVGIQQVP
jgi:hypothetical protein